MRRALAVTLAVVLGIGAVLFLVGLIPHSPDITRQRVEADMSVVWPNQYGRARYLEGLQPLEHVTDSVSCDKGGPKVKDSGPGRNWVCLVAVSAAGVRHGKPIRYEVIVRSEACYTATDPALIEDPFLNDVHTGKSVGNPLYQFDGCFNVYDGKTSVTK